MFVYFPEKGGFTKTKRGRRKMEGIWKYLRGGEKKKERGKKRRRGGDGEREGGWERE